MVIRIHRNPVKFARISCPFLSSYFCDGYYCINVSYSMLAKIINFWCGYFLYLACVRYGSSHFFFKMLESEEHHRKNSHYHFPHRRLELAHGKKLHLLTISYKNHKSISYEMHTMLITMNRAQHK